MSAAEPLPRQNRDDRRKAELIAKVERLDPGLFPDKVAEWTRGGFPSRTMEFIYTTDGPARVYVAGLLEYVDDDGTREVGKTRNRLTTSTGDGADSHAAASRRKNCPVDGPLPLPDRFDRQLAAWSREYDDLYGQAEELLDKMHAIENQLRPLTRTQAIRAMKLAGEKFCSNCTGRIATLGDGKSRNGRCSPCAGYWNKYARERPTYLWR
jgi:hypothetical protein